MNNFMRGNCLRVFAKPENATLILIQRKIVQQKLSYFAAQETQFLLRPGKYFQGSRMSANYSCHKITPRKLIFFKFGSKIFSRKKSQKLQTDVEDA